MLQRLLKFQTELNLLFLLLNWILAMGVKEIALFMLTSILRIALSSTTERVLGVVYANLHCRHTELIIIGLKKPLIHLISKPRYPLKSTATTPQDIQIFFRSEKSWFIYYSSPVSHTILKVNSSSWVIGRKITSLVVVVAAVVGLATTFVKFCDRKV